MKTYFFSYCFFYVCALNLSAQAVVELANPSFEKLAANVPNWYDGNFVGEAGMDFQPGKFNVKLAPIHGETYISLVTRENGTWESVYQTLKTPLQKGVCYKTSVYLAKDSLKSPTLTSSNPSDFAEPIQLQIWGNHQKTSILHDELLFVSPPITNTKWEKHEIMFKAQDTIHSILVEGYYSDRKSKKNGNLLIDNFSPILQCSCDSIKPTDAKKYFLAHYRKVEEIIQYNTPYINIENILAHLPSQPVSPKIEPRPHAYLYEIANAFRYRKTWTLVIAIKVTNQRKLPQMTQKNIDYLKILLFSSGIQNWQIHLVKNKVWGNIGKQLNWIGKSPTIMMGIVKEGDKNPNLKD